MLFKLVESDLETNKKIYEYRKWLNSFGGKLYRNMIKLYESKGDYLLAKFLDSCKLIVFDRDDPNFAIYPDASISSRGWIIRISDSFITKNFDNREKMMQEFMHQLHHEVLHCVLKHYARGLRILANEMGMDTENLTVADIKKLEQEYYRVKKYKDFENYPKFSIFNLAGDAELSTFLSPEEVEIAEKYGEILMPNLMNMYGWEEEMSYEDMVVFFKDLEELEEPEEPGTPGKPEEGEEPGEDEDDYEPGEGEDGEGEEPGTPGTPGKPGKGGKGGKGREGGEPGEGEDGEGDKGEGGGKPKPYSYEVVNGRYIDKHTFIPESFRKKCGG